jgi:hypothetical protein
MEIVDPSTDPKAYGADAFAQHICDLAVDNKTPHKTFSTVMAWAIARYCHEAEVPISEVLEIVNRVAVAHSKHAYPEDSFDLTQ